MRLFLFVAVGTALLSGLLSEGCAPGDKPAVARPVVRPEEFVATTQQQDYVRRKSWVVNVAQSTYIRLPDGSVNQSPMQEFLIPGDYRTYTLDVYSRAKGIFIAHVKSDYDPRTEDTSVSLLTPDGKIVGYEKQRFPKTDFSPEEWENVFRRFVAKSLSEARNGTVAAATKPKQYAGRWRGQKAAIIEYDYTRKYDTTPYRKPKVYTEVPGRLQYFVSPETGLLQGECVYENYSGEQETLLSESEYAYAPAPDEEKWFTPDIVARLASRPAWGVRRPSSNSSPKP